VALYRQVATLGSSLLVIWRARYNAVQSINQVAGAVGTVQAILQNPFQAIIGGAAGALIQQANTILGNANITFIDVGKVNDSLVLATKQFAIVQAKVTEFTKLSTLAVKPVVEALQQLLADYQIYYSNLRGLHWNVKGKEFFVLHAQFENMYDNAATKIDEIAERILMLDGIPAHNYSEYLKTSNVKELGYVSNGDEGVTHVMETISHFVTAERTILSLASEVGDETTVAMMSDYIKEQEKLLWMLVAYKS
jgi:starvation-inducible DNA-binding protein